MKNPIPLASRHPRLHESSSAAWGLEIVLQLHDQQRPGRYPFQKKRPFPEDDFAPGFGERLRERGIETELLSYGADFARFEAELKRRPQERFPLVQVPAAAEVVGDALRIRSRTFVVGEARGQPVFLLRQARSATVSQISLKQMRLLHDAWRTWPALLPSMLLTVLWHRGANE